MWRRVAVVAAAAFSIGASPASADLAADEPTPISTIRGPGGASPLLHHRVTTSGVVTATTADGWYLQDPRGDGDAATPDAVFVYTRGEAPVPAVGDRIRLDATVESYAPRPADGHAAARPRTELHPLGAWTLEARGYTVAAAQFTLPSASADEALQLNGMRVRLAGPLTVSDLATLGSRGRLVTAAGGRLEAPTNRLPPGPAALALAAANDARRIVVEIGPIVAGAAVPELRVGDTLDAVTGVLEADDASAGLRLRAVSPLRVTARNARPPHPPDVGGTLAVAAMNLDNAFTTYADGSTFDGGVDQGCRLGATRSKRHCRGPANEVEGERQHAKLLAALTGLDADVVALMEVQNDGMTTVQDLVDGLDARADPAGRYAALPLDPARAGSDAIQTAMVYRPARLRPVGAPLRDSDAVHLRPPLAQTFVDQRSGAVFSVVAVHFKSKRCGDARHHDAATGDDADQGDLQGCWNARRRRESQALLAFVDRVRAASGSADVLLVGDFNAYAAEDPVRLLVDAGFVDLLARGPGLAYSYVYDAASGRLDHALASASLAAKVTGAAEWHIDADEPPFLDYRLVHRLPSRDDRPACIACTPDRYAPTPYRASDHDPFKVGLDLGSRRATTNPP